jgi:hypothetical protein
MEGLLTHVFEHLRVRRLSRQVRIYAHSVYQPHDLLGEAKRRQQSSSDCYGGRRSRSSFAYLLSLRPRSFSPQRWQMMLPGAPCSEVPLFETPARLIRTRLRLAERMHRAAETLLLRLSRPRTRHRRTALSSALKTRQLHRRAPRPEALLAPSPPMTRRELLCWRGAAAASLPVPLSPRPLRQQ